MTQHVPSLIVSHSSSQTLDVCPLHRFAFFTATFHIPSTKQITFFIHSNLFYRFLPKISMWFLSFYWIFLDPPGSKRFDVRSWHIVDLSLRSACPCSFWLVSCFKSFIFGATWDLVWTCIWSQLGSVLTVSLNPWGPFFGRISEFRMTRGTLAWKTILSGM